MTTKTWKEDEKTFKSNRLNEGLGLTTSILSNIKDKLTTVAEDNGWSCQMDSNSKEGVKFVLMPIDPKDSDSFVSHEEMMDIIKDEFSTFEEDSMEVLFTPHVRWMLPIITVMFHSETALLRGHFSLSIEI